MTITGTRISSHHDEHGPIYVYQTRSSRILSFDGHIEQSALNMKEPHRLLYKYTQAMMTGFLFIPEQNTATILGLGAGSLAHCLLNYSDTLQVHAVEYREQVINVAKTYFSLPVSSRLHLHVADATHFIYKPAVKSDIIFSDLYLSSGMEPRQMQKSFLHNCRRALTKNGVLVLNLWNQDFKSTDEIESLLAEEFDGQLLTLDVESGNTIVLAFKREIPRIQKQDLLAQARILEDQLDCPIERYAKLIWSQHKSKFDI